MRRGRLAIAVRLAPCVALWFAAAGCGDDDATIAEGGQRDAAVGPGRDAAAGNGGRSAGVGAAGASGSAGARAGGRGGANAIDAGPDASSAIDGGGSGEPLPAADFEARCAAPGVIVCRGFDSEAELNRISLETETGAEADSTGSMDHIAIDTAIKASGAGALRFEIVGQTAANHSGAFRQLMGQAFGPGTAFYAQFRLRLSRTFIDTLWDDVVGSSPKIVLFHHSSATCNDIEWTQVMNGWYDHIATMYTHCGQYQPGQHGDDMFFQQGDYECPYGADYGNDDGCLKYTPERWMTFYFKASVGAYGQPTTHLEAWVAQDGGPYRQWIDDPQFTLYAEGESAPGFDSVYLTTYMTAKDETAEHPTAYAWYDELIVSTEPIAVPEE